MQDQDFEYFGRKQKTSNKCSRHNAIRPFLELRHRTHTGQYATRCVYDAACQPGLIPTSNPNASSAMATPGSNSGGGAGNGQSSQGAESSIPHRPIEALENTQSTSAVVPKDGQSQGPKKRRNHRSGKKKKPNRRQSFLPGNEEGEMMPPGMSNRNAEGPLSATARPGLYRNLSDTSINSEALLDHRYTGPCDCILWDTHIF